jgi:anaerobic selenocysteine-containing dehydrogenase
VVHEQFFTDTTDYADIVLPATTFFEHKDLQTSYGHYHVQISNAAIAPLGECRSNVEVFRALAERMGFEEECFRESVDEMIDSALASSNPWLRGIDRERLEREHRARLSFAQSEVSASGCTGEDPSVADAHSGKAARASSFLPFAKGNFPTASGKAELYSEALKLQGLDPVASFSPPEESRHTAAAKKFPLEFLARKADNCLNSSFCNVPAVQAMEEPGRLEISASDARPRGIADGNPVRVFNQRGEVVLRARVNGAVQPGTVAARLGWAKLSEGGGSVNALTSEKLTDMGNSATFYSVLVEVELADPAQ